MEVKAGMVAGTILKRSNVKTRDDWQKTVDELGPEACKLLSQKPGFRGLLWFWNNDDSGDVIMMGLWEGLEQRLNYEDSIAQSVREITNTLFDGLPNRPRYVLTHCHPPATEQLRSK